MTGIMALCATSGYYDSTEIATRILPNVVVLTIDPDRFVLIEIFELFWTMDIIIQHSPLPTHPPPRKGEKNKRRKKKERANCSLSLEISCSYTYLVLIMPPLSIVIFTNKCQGIRILWYIRYLFSFILVYKYSLYLTSHGCSVKILEAIFCCNWASNF